MDTQGKDEQLNQLRELAARLQPVQPQKREGEIQHGHVPPRQPHRQARQDDEVEGRSLDNRGG